MKRLYFIVDDLDTAEQVSETLHANGITDSNLHAVSRNAAGLRSHHVHSATPYQSLDIVHSGLRWALGGAALAALLSVLVVSVQPLPMRVDWTHAAYFTLLCGCFGGWLGAMVGMSRENYKLAAFHDQIVAGQTLLLVDVPAANVAVVRGLVETRYPAAHFGGVDSPLINPLERARELHAHVTT